MPLIQEKHPQAIRWFHWLHFPILSMMIWSGLLIYWANDEYRIGWGEHTLIHFFPDGLYKAFHLAQRLPDGMSWHFFLMWIFAINGLAYFAYLIYSGEWRYLFPNGTSFKEAFQVMLHDLHLSKKHPPKRKFNGAQQIAYTGVIFMGAGSLLTGLAIYKPIQASFLTTALGGYEAARLEHFLLMWGFIFFFLIHISQVIRAGWNNFRAMVAGYEIEESEK
jgi:thiosulfate reductase cytochrome b subunit